MSKNSKAYRAALEKIDRDNLYTPSQAAKLAKETSSTKQDSTVEVAIRLGVDPRKADQMVRGTVNLPHGTGKTARVAVFAVGEKADEATAAGADVVGSDDLIEKIQGGFLDFDAAIATPDQMAKVGRIARILGPRGLMPNPKTGTVTPDITKAVNDIKGGKINFRIDKQANLHFVIGKASFDEKQLVENYGAALDEVLRHKPSSSKGRYLKKITVSTTTGPGIPVDPAVGMLTMGLGGGFVTSWIGDPGAVTEYNVRFTAVVPVPNDGKGAEIVFSGRVKSVDPDSKSVTIAITATTGGKKIFGRAIASAKLA